MIAITFRDFFNENYEEEGYSLYLLRDGDAVLYIGISNENIWTRWFGGGTSHMRITTTKSGSLVPVANGGKRVGEKIQLNYPESADWIIELWKNDDCIDFLSKHGYDVSHLKRMELLEPEMIRYFNPLYNVTYNGSASNVSRTEREKKEEEKYDAIYRRIFG